MFGTIGRSLFFSLVLHRVWGLTADESSNLQDPCHFPAPHYAHFPELCQFPYHRLGLTEAEILNDRFSKYSLAGCVDCKASSRGPSYCVPRKRPHQARVNLIIVPYANVQRIESCVGGRLATRGWRREMPLANMPRRSRTTGGKSGCSVDLTVFTLHSTVPLAQPGPFVVRFFSNRLAEFSQLGSVEAVSAERRPFDVLFSTLNQSLADARIDDRFVAEQELSTPKSNHVPLWAFQVSAVLLALVGITLYVGRWVSKKFDLRAQQKKYNMNRSNAHNAAANALSGGGSTNVLNGGAGASAPSASLMNNLTANQTKSSMMFRQFSNHAKKQKSRTPASLQQI
ncbi:hypothetical protein M3Y99_00730800 [Aphelenchoides fujianensis]|nr:hypothetical protein M3Y99_00730800 [Aphelenchoides fujianensis]